jgi:intein/homing endonuclease/superfamily II DNA or RNA helicase
MSEPLFFVCANCKKPGYEEPSYRGNSIFHEKCSDIAVQKTEIMRQIDEQYDPTKTQARIFFEGDVIVIDHPFNKNVNDAYRKYFAFNTWKADKRRREIKKSKINSISANFLLREIQFVGPEYNWVKNDDVVAFLNEKSPPDAERAQKIKELSEIKKNFDADTDLSHMKLPLLGYQRAGVAFLESADGVVLIGDQMGLGKCVIKTSTYTNLGVLKIEELFDKASQKTSFQTDSSGGEWFKTNQLLKCISINKDGKQEEKEVSDLYREKINSQIKKVTVNDGTDLHLTIPHKLLTLNGWSNQYSVGDYILLPREINDHSQIKNIDKRLNLFFSCLVSEGYEDHGMFEITQNDQKILEEILQNIKSYCLDHNIKFNNPKVLRDERNTTYRLHINSVALQKHLESLGYIYGKRSKDKQIPNIVLNSTKDDIAYFLKNYFEAEACVLKDGIIEIATASEELKQQLSFLLRRLGILIRFKAKQKMATNGKRIKRTYYFGIIGGTSLRTYKEKVGFVSKEKSLKLETVCQKPCNDNIDTVPTLDIFHELTAMGLPAAHTGISNIYQKYNASRQSLPAIIKNLTDIISGEQLQKYKKLKKSKWTDAILEVVHRLNLNVYFLKIHQVELYDYEGYVYDMTVKDNHNYIGNGVFCHNTSQALGYTSKFNQKTIVLTLASVKYNWKNEVEKFTNKSAIVIHDKSTIEELKKFDYVITNYDQLKKWEPVLKKMKFDTIILDESHYISNHAAQRTKAVFRLFKKIKHRILLSGTPTKNKPIELFYQLKFLHPEEFSNKTDFGMRYCGPTQGYNDHWEFKGFSNLDELNERIAPFYIRRLKQDVLKDLPPKRISNIVYNLDKKDRQEYDDMVDGLSRDPETRESILTRTQTEKANKLMALMKLCSKKKVPYVVEFVKQMIQEDLTSNKKIVIMAHFRETQKLLAKAFEGISVTLFADMKDYERQESVDRFTNDPNIRIFIGSTIAAGTGINLVAADTLVFADLLWTPATMKQAEDRLHRMGQANNTFIYYMTFDETIENSIWFTLEKKLLVTAQTHGDVEYDENAIVTSLAERVFKKKDDGK